MLFKDVSTEMEEQMKYISEVIQKQSWLSWGISQKLLWLRLYKAISIKCHLVVHSLCHRFH